MVMNKMVVKMIMMNRNYNDSKTNNDNDEQK